MRRCLPLVSILLLGLLVGTDGAADDKDADAQAIGEVVQRYFAAYAKKDLDACLALWSEQAPDRKGRRQAMQGLFAETGPLQLKGLTLIQVRRERTAARVRVRVELLGNDARTGQPHPSFGTLNRVLRLQREEGTWKIYRYGQAEQDLLDRLLAADGKAARETLYREDRDLLSAELVRLATDACQEEAEQGRYAEALRLSAVSFEIAEPLGDKAALAQSHFARAFLSNAQRQYAEALAGYERALALYREAKDRAGEDRTLNNLGNVYKSTGRYAEALPHYQDSLTIKRALGDRAGEATTLHNIGVVYQDMGRYAEALQHYQNSLQIVRALGDRAGEADALNNIGIVYKSTGRYAEALQHYQDSLKIARALKNQASEARTLNNLGNVYRDTGRYALALEHYQDSLKLVQALGDRTEEARTLGNIGLVYWSTGRYGEALQHCQDSLKLARALGFRAVEAGALHNIGIVYWDTGRYGEALQHYQDSLKITRALGNRAGEAHTLIGIGLVYHSLGRYGEALQHHQDCLKVVRALGDRAGEAHTLNNIALVYEATGQYALALPHYQDSLKIVRALGDRAMEAQTLINIGHVYESTGRYTEALESLEAGRKLAMSIGEPQAAFRSQWGIGMILSAQKRWPEAAAAFRTAIDRIEDIREGTHEQSLQTSFLAQYTTPYHGLARCLIEMGQPAQAFAIAEQAKARALVDLLQQGKANIHRGMTTAEQREEQRLLDRLTALGVQREDRTIDAPRQATLARELVRARQDYDAFRQALYLHHTDLQVRRAAFAPVSLTDLQRDLFAPHPRLVILSYLLGDQQSFLFVLSAGPAANGPARLVVHPLDVSKADLTERVKEFGAVCAHGDLMPAGEDLYRWLLAPAAEALAGASQVVILPDGVLHTLPFQALRGKTLDEQDGPYLIEHCAVSYAPSATALREMVHLSQRRQQQFTAALGGPLAVGIGKFGQLLAVGIGDFGQRERRLPQAEAEAQALAGLFGVRGRLLRGGQTSKAVVRSAWGGRRYLHFATHGRLNPDAPLYSALVLSPASAQDEGLLFGRELLDEDLSAELAVLSACETGLGQQTSGEGLLGLTWAWFVAGVPATVASQWSVADDSTARFMKVFYQSLQAGTPKAEALRRAQLALLKDRRTRHPFFWAPFVLVGDPW